MSENETMNRCEATTRDMTGDEYRCVLSSGHDGPHKGWVPIEGWTEDLETEIAWPESTPKSEQCGAVTHGLRCLLPKGHTGLHKTWGVGSSYTWLDPTPEPKRCEAKMLNANIRCVLEDGHDGDHDLGCLANRWPYNKTFDPAPTPLDKALREELDYIGNKVEGFKAGWAARGKAVEEELTRRHFGWLGNINYGHGLRNAILANKDLDANQ